MIQIADIMLSEFDEALHPRDEHGRFATSLGDAETGKPLRAMVWHGTPDGRFLKAEGFRATSPSNETGINFSEDYATAHSYADPHRAWDYQNSEPMTVQKRITLLNPLVVNLHGNKWNLGDYHKFKTDAAAAGHDGIVFQNIRDHYHPFQSKKPSHTAVVFDPKAIDMSLSDEIHDNPDDAAADTDTDPSDGQKEAGNYAKGKFRWNGLTISIETPAGEDRTGTDSDGKDWSVTLPVHYGYVKGTLSDADGDHVDCFVGPDLDSREVFIIDQYKPDSAVFDEHKCMIGFNDVDDAVDAYEASYSPGFADHIFGDVTAMPAEQFGHWLENGDTGAPAAEQELVLSGLDDEPRDEHGRWTSGSGTDQMTLFDKGTKDVTKLPAFKQWFGKSKIVDEDGKPLKVYHGTVSDISSDPDRLWVTDDPATAGYYADRAAFSRMMNDNPDYDEAGELDEAFIPNEAPEDDQQVFPLYVSADKVLDIEHLGDAPDPWDLYKYLAKKGIVEKMSKTDFDDYRNEEFGDTEPTLWKQIEQLGYDTDIEKKGYQAVKITDIVATGLQSAKNHSAWLLLNGSSVKSASGNRGTFDKSNTHINMASTPWSSTSSMLADAIANSSRGEVEQYAHKLGHSSVNDLTWHELWDYLDEDDDALADYDIDPYDDDFETDFSLGVKDEARDERGRWTSGAYKALLKKELGDDYETKLLHGSASPDIESGIEPRVGDFIRDAYQGEYENAGLDFDEIAKPLVFMSPLGGEGLHDEEYPGDSAFTAMQHQVATKLNKGFHDVTAGDVEKHGHIAVISDDGNFTRIGEDWGDHPHDEGYVAVEPGDVVSEEDVLPDRVISGKPLVTLWKAQRRGHNFSLANDTDDEPRDEHGRWTSLGGGHLADTPAFKSWFGDSKVVNAEGKPLVVYHGAMRPDRIGNAFDPTRATSGPMPFFTDDADIASNYATGKSDTSLEQPADYNEWFRVSLPNATKPMNIDRVWGFLSSKERAEIAAKLPHVTNQDEEGNSIDSYRLGGPNEYGLSGKDHWAWTIKEAHGNVLKAAKTIWLEGGELFNNEEEFLKVLKLGGLNQKTVFDDPQAAYSGIFPVHLKIEHPLDTAKIPKALITSLTKAAKGVEPSERFGSDMWDKRTISGKDWIKRLKDDQKENTTHAWTSIPDFVTEHLKSKGYDGVRDTGGKMGGRGHDVWIPFSPGQVKSATGNKGTFDQNNPNINMSFDESEHERDEQGKFTTGAGLHNVKLPKNKKRLNIAPAHEALKQMGYDLDFKSSKTTTDYPGATSPEAFHTSYELVHPTKGRQRMSAEAIRDFVYAHKKPTGLTLATDDGRWVTLEPSGTHVHIGDGDSIDKGPAAMAKHGLGGVRKPGQPKWAKVNQLDKRVKAGTAADTARHGHGERRLLAWRTAHEVGTHAELSAHAKSLGYEHANQMRRSELLKYVAKRRAEPGHVDAAGKNAPPKIPTPQGVPGGQQHIRPKQPAAEHEHGEHGLGEELLHHTAHVIGDVGAHTLFGHHHHQHRPGEPMQASIDLGGIMLAVEDEPRDEHGRWTSDGDFADHLAETYHVGKYSLEPRTLLEAHEKQLSIRTVQEGGSGKSHIARVSLKDAPSAKLKSAIFSQLHGAISDESPKSWLVVSNTNTAHLGTAQWVQSLVAAGAYVKKSGVTNPAFKA